MICYGGLCCVASEAITICVRTGMRGGGTHCLSLLDSQQLALLYRFSPFAPCARSARSEEYKDQTITTAIWEDGQKKT